MKLVNEKLLDLFRGDGPCEWCRRWSYCRHAAHVFSRGQGGAFRLDHRLNIVSLCWQCHGNHHAGRKPTRGDLLVLISGRERVPLERLIPELARMRTADTAEGRRREAKRKRERARVRRLARAGVCLRCRGPVEKGHARCTACRKSLWVWQKEYRGRTGWGKKVS